MTYKTERPKSSDWCFLRQSSHRGGFCVPAHFRHIPLPQSTHCATAGSLGCFEQFIAFKFWVNNYVHLYSFLPFQRKIKKIISTMIASLTKVQKKSWITKKYNILFTSGAWKVKWESWKFLFHFEDSISIGLIRNSIILSLINLKRYLCDDMNNKLRPLQNLI